MHTRIWPNVSRIRSIFGHSAFTNLEKLIPLGFSILLIYIYTKVFSLIRSKGLIEPTVNVSEIKRFKYGNCITFERINFIIICCANISIFNPTTAIFLIQISLPGSALIAVFAKEMRPISKSTVSYILSYGSS